jgi:hypothetical protein
MCVHCVVCVTYHVLVLLYYFTLHTTRRFLLHPVQEEAETREKEGKARRRLLRVMELAQCHVRFFHKVHLRHAGKKKKKGGKKKKTKK